MKSILIFTLMWLGTATAVYAEQAPASSTIRVSGNATVMTKPDRVEIDIGVVTQSAQAQASATENASRLDGVIAALRKTVGATADIKTVSYELTPNYRYQSGVSEPSITGYTATNIVRVVIDNLDKIGDVIDAATHSGANRVQDIRFTLRDPEVAQREALREAAERAKRKADTLASALGVKVIRVLTAEDLGIQPPPIRPLVFARARTETAREPTPVEPGTLDVSANVTLTVEVGS